MAVTCDVPHPPPSPPFPLVCANTQDVSRSVNVRFEPTGQVLQLVLRPATTAEDFLGRTIEAGGEVDAGAVLGVFGEGEDRPFRNRDVLMEVSSLSEGGDEVHFVVKAVPISQQRNVRAMRVFNEKGDYKTIGVPADAMTSDGPRRCGAYFSGRKGRGGVGLIVSWLPWLACLDPTHAAFSLVSALPFPRLVQSRQSPFVNLRWTQRPTATSWPTRHGRKAAGGDWLLSLVTLSPSRRPPLTAWRSTTTLTRGWC